MANRLPSCTRPPGHSFVRTVGRKAAPMAALLAAAVLTLPVRADPAAGTPVQVPSLDLDAASGQPVLLPATWFAAPGGAAGAPALVLLHGCGGRLDGKGRLAARFAELAARLNAMGIHALVPDSLAPRGERELCTQRNGQRRVTQLNRRRDALGALQWLAQQPGVDAARLGLLGWSNGGSAVLAATNLNHGEVAGAAVRASLAVAYYPGCEAERRRGYRPMAPLLMLLGEADDWTPVGPCKALAAHAAAGAAATPPIAFESYPGAHHGFDGTAPVRLRREVPGGANPGQGVHVGAHPEARAAAAQRLAQFLRDQWKLEP